MTTRAQLVRTLEAIGAEGAAVPPPRFVDQLEARLLEQLDSLSVVADIVDDDDFDDFDDFDEVDRRRHRRQRRTLPAWSGIAAAVVLVVGIVLASVQEPTTRLATPLSPAATPSTTDDTTPDEPVPDGTDRSDDATNRDGSAADQTAPAESQDRAETPSTEYESAPPAGAWRYAEPSEERFVLEATATATGAELTWAGYEGDDFFSYVVLRAYEEDPVYPRRGNDSTEFVYRSESRDQNTWSDTNLTVEGETRYLVVVFAETGRELARSNVAGVQAGVGVTISLPI
jgi:hypothetical protein